jgi:hypothetical protein
MNVAETNRARGSEPLSSIYIRLTQQNPSVVEAIKRSRLRNKNKPFKPLHYPTKYCASQRNLVVTKNNLTGELLSAKSTPRYCKQWACSYCGPRMAVALKYKILELALKYKLDHFLTITLAPDRIPITYKNQTGKYISYLFNRFRLYVRRKINPKFLYIWIKQYQKNGNAHLHILINAYLPIKKVRAEWERIGGGTQMKIKLLESEIDIDHVTRYLTNYLIDGVKDGFGYVYGERRYGLSNALNSYLNSKKPLYEKATLSDMAHALPPEKFFKLHGMIYNADENCEEIEL